MNLIHLIKFFRTLIHIETVKDPNPNFHSPPTKRIYLTNSLRKHNQNFGTLSIKASTL